jgi:hypothetical protein
MLFLSRIGLAVIIGPHFSRFCSFSFYCNLFFLPFVRRLAIYYIYGWRSKERGQGRLVDNRAFDIAQPWGRGHVFSAMIINHRKDGIRGKLGCLWKKVRLIFFNCFLVQEQREIYTWMVYNEW